jgi:ATP-binding cassette subfamily C (CFTR/MRP) protein 1
MFPYHPNGPANVPFVLAPAATFAAYAIQAHLRGSSSLDTVKAFTSLALITLVSYPASRLLCAVPNTAASLGCFDRIQQFLLTAEEGICSQEDNHNSHQTSNSARNIHSNINTISSSEEIMASIKNGEIAPTPDSNIVLHNLNLAVPSGSIVMITGPVGSGKSTLLKALLGEAACSSGDITVIDCPIGYCAQTPWIIHGSIRNNICGPIDTASIDEAWYQNCIDSCDLRTDLLAMPTGDQTIVGSRGETLSGGQKHRIALARALYQKPKLFFLDNVLDAVDPTTDDWIMRKLFGEEGLFKQHGFTVVLTTHAGRYLDRVSLKIS